ncbi:MAG: MarR family transcriptional regulator [Polyangiaceae bacterium]
MVKLIDDNSLVDHIGVDLWRAATVWRERLHAEMVALGHDWYGDARGTIAAHLDPRGMSQSALVSRMATTKQAVQQLLDGLEADGIIRREPDPEDGRGKRVIYTAKGLAAQRDATRIKRKIERDFEAKLGARAFRELRASLRKLTEA